jgi:predicted Zn finger-like uncharacterized protein
MILTCPACATRFAVESDALGPNGRRVRCGSCRHVWHQAPPELDEEAHEPVAAAPLAAPATEPDEAPVRMRRPPPKPARRRNGGASVAWMALALVVLIVIGGTVVAKDSILEAWPASARVYAAFGMMGGTSSAGLELRKVSWKRETADNVPLLSIEGEVANTSQGVRSVPRIRAAVVGKDGQELKSWVFAPPKVNLIPGESVPFHTELKNPPDGAERLTMIFASGA